jgi:KUP system potassium uptake protein
MFTLMITWKQGRSLLHERRQAQALPLGEFLDTLFAMPPQRASGLAVFLTPEMGTTPPALLHNLKHNKVLHDVNLFVTVQNHETPWIGMNKRIAVDALGHNCWQIVLHYGFKNEPNVPEALQQIKGHGFEFDPLRVSYFLSRESVVPNGSATMSVWREKLFAHMHHNASGAAAFLHLPSNAVVELGAKVDF